jgi:hypothetical protein
VRRHRCCYRRYGSKCMNATVCFCSPHLCWLPAAGYMGLLLPGCQHACSGTVLALGSASIRVWPNAAHQQGCEPSCVACRGSLNEDSHALKTAADMQTGGQVPRTTAHTAHAGSAHKRLTQTPMFTQSQPRQAGQAQKQSAKSTLSSGVSAARLVNPT